MPLLFCLLKSPRTLVQLESKSGLASKTEAWEISRTRKPTLVSVRQRYTGSSYAPSPPFLLAFTPETASYSCYEQGGFRDLKK